MENTENFLNEVIKDLSQKIESQKEALIEAELKQRIGNGINLHEEHKRKFPRLKMEKTHQGIENWYWDDGTENGMLLISFWTEVQSENINGSFAITSVLKYK